MGRRKQTGQRDRTAGREGQSLAECAFILLLVAVACVAASTLLGTTLQGFYNGFNGSF